MNQTNTTVRIGDFGRRLRVRRVDESALERSVREAALKAGKIAIEVRHGGTVANSYGYAAETEAVLAIGLPTGAVVMAIARIPANKATCRGAALAAGQRLAGRKAANLLAKLFDERCTRSRPTMDMVARELSAIEIQSQA